MASYMRRSLVSITLCAEDESLVTSRHLATIGGVVEIPRMRVLVRA